MSATQTQKINKRLEALKEDYNGLKKEYLDEHHAEIYDVLEKIAKMQYAKTPECAQFQEEFYQDYFTYNWKSRYNNTIQDDRLVKLREKAVAAGKTTPETKKPETENTGKNIVAVVEPVAVAEPVDIKPKTKVAKVTKPKVAKPKVANMKVEVLLFENGKRKTVDTLNYHQLEKLSEHMKETLDVKEKDFGFRYKDEEKPVTSFDKYSGVKFGDEHENEGLGLIDVMGAPIPGKMPKMRKQENEMIIKKINYNMHNQTIGNGTNQFPLNQRIPVHLTIIREPLTTLYKGEVTIHWDIEIMFKDDLVLLPDEPTPEPETPNLHQKKVAELKEMCKSRGIKVPSKAKKDDIVQLLVDNVVSTNTNTNTNNTKSIEKMTVAQLKEQCKEQNIKYNSKVKKADLIALLSSGDSVQALPVLVPRTPEIKTPDEPEHINVEVLFYEDGVRRTFDTMSGCEIASVVDAITDICKVVNDDVIVYNDEIMIVKNVKCDYSSLHLNEVRVINVPQYGVNPWGKVEIKLVLVEHEDNV